MKLKKLFMVSAVTCGALMLSACGSGGVGTDNDAKGLDPNQVWVAYGNASTSSYAEVAAAGEAFTKEYGTKVRITTADTSIGRITPIKQGQADYSRLSGEGDYAYEGTHEFANPAWGPQDIRGVFSPPTTVGMAVRADSGIDSLDDLKGRKLPWTVGTPGAQERVKSILDYAGIDHKDVKMVEVEYTSQPKALQDKKIDAAYFAVASPSIIEVNSGTKLKWLDFDKGEEAEKRLQVGSPSVAILPFESPIGMEGKKEKSAPTYSIQMTAYADKKSEDEVYELVKALNETFPQYKNSTTTSPLWDITTIDWTPRVVPFHEGTVKYLKEKDLWSEEFEERNNYLIERGEKLREGWQEVNDGSKNGEKLAKAWNAWIEENAPLEPIAAQ